jgi:hypothetical protein
MTLDHDIAAMRQKNEHSDGDSSFDELLFNVVSNLVQRSTHPTTVHSSADGQLSAVHDVRRLLMITS